jgi:pimeloyl-ACP methyl ester carboxylesterase
MDLAHYDWAGSDGAPVVFSHATGFHGRVWDQVIRNLTPEAGAIALDMRGHGRSQQVPPPMRWRDFGEDVAALGEKLGWKGAVGVGHSMGGYAITLAAALKPGMFSALVLLDPVIMVPESYKGPWVPEHFARKRRREWASSEEMFERFRTRPPFNAWDQQVLRDYCDYALNDSGELACPPEVEGSIYEKCTLPEADISVALERIEIPVLVVRSAIEFVLGFTAMEASPTNPRLAEILPHGRDEHWRNVSHFIPMEVPERVASLISTQGWRR